MTTYYLDFETRSSVAIDHGIPNYLANKDAAIICMGYKIDHNLTKLWTPSMPIPFQIRPKDEVHAFNALFDFQVWNTLGPKYGFAHSRLKNWHCAMGLAGRYTHFQSLEMVAKTLKVRTQKGREGKALIKKICIPPFNYTREELKRFYVYCQDDVDAMYEVIHALPTPVLSSQEQEAWFYTMLINMAGVPIDTSAVKRIHHVMKMYVEEESKRLPKLTGYAIKKATQNVAIVKWAFSMGVSIPNVTKAVVAEYIELLSRYPTGSKEYTVREVLKIRQHLAKTSTAKYKKFMDLDHDGRIYENLRYYGAATGRWAGMNAQLHNLPRAKVDDPEEMIHRFYGSHEGIEDPMEAAKGLIRSMIVAPNGFMLIVLDYAAIENRILMWLCSETAALDMIRQGYDQYKMMASELFNVGYDDVSKDQRFVGKTLILGAGYNLGGKGYKAYAAGYGIELSEDEAEVAIKKYRDRYRNVVRYWYGAKDTIIHAIQYPGFKVTYGGCDYIVQRDHSGHPWLVMTLPSGRSLFYSEPTLKDDKYGAVPTHMGINSYSRKWDRLKLIPGRIIENIVQALARDVLLDAKIKIMQGYKVILSVHDEILIECRENLATDTYHKVVNIMKQPPPWGRGIPLDVDGFITKRYKKG